MIRLPMGGRIDRTRPIRFTFNGRAMTGFAGDTLASALLANGVTVVGRSFKYHRPRGIVAAGEDEPNAIMQVSLGHQWAPNLKATMVELYDGLEAVSVNCWPGPDFDLGGLADLFHWLLPAGFYYRTFKGFRLGGRTWLGWPFWETFIRRAAGLGRVPAGPDAEKYLRQYAHCDTLVVGAGPAGRAAARTAAASGADVILLDDQAEIGGTSLWQGEDFSSQAAVTELRAAGIRILPRTTATGYYDHEFVVAVERLTDHLPPEQRSGLPRQRLWQIRAGQVILATGAFERPMPFPDNDRPGVMLLSAALQYARRWAVLPGMRAVVVTNNCTAYDHARQLQGLGLSIAALIDTREVARHDAPFPVYAATEVAGVRGRRRIRGVVLGDGRSIACDCILMAGGWNPTVHLLSQSGGKLAWNGEKACFVPHAVPDAVSVVGAAAGAFDAGYAVSPHWLGRHGGRQWIDFQSDVVATDVIRAGRENLLSVEHLKRYTTTGMATDQGKTSNVNALALLALATGRDPSDVGTTTFRPPYTPIPFSTVASAARGRLQAPRRYVPAHDGHIRLGAHMEDFGSWMRPEYYTRNDEDREAAARREHMAVRASVGIFESSPIGKLEVWGADAARFLDLIYANTMSTLPVGSVRYGLMLNENGVIIDDGVCARIGPDRFLLSPTSGGAARVAAMLEEWLQCEYVDFDVCVVDVTTAWAAYAVAGPRARNLLEKLAIDIDLSPAAFRHMRFREARLNGGAARIMRVSYSGELQYEIQVPASRGPALWENLVDLAQQMSGAPVGIEAWLRLRLEKGFIHIGSDTDGSTLPGDIGMAGPIANKKQDFTGRRSLTRPDALRSDREQLVGLRAALPDSTIPVGACAFFGTRPAPPTERIGRVTSSCFSPVLNSNIALALIRNGRARHGERIRFWSDGRIWEAEICDPVFYDPEGSRLHV